MGPVWQRRAGDLAAHVRRALLFAILYAIGWVIVLWHRRRLSMKPGITGLWQVTARRSDDFDDRAELDLNYIDRWSLRLDFKILARTLPAALEGR